MAGGNEINSLRFSRKVQEGIGGFSLWTCGKAGWRRDAGLADALACGSAASARGGGVHAATVDSMSA